MVAWKTLPFALALVLGILCWLPVAPHGPDQERWDNPIYWRVAYPALCIGCAVLGFLFSTNAWAYGLLAMSTQGLPPILANLDAELVGVSIVLLATMTIPPVLAGLLGGWMGSRRRSV